jgi:energy-coupling factor transporter ATP-binding protein EcfA2
MIGGKLEPAPSTKSICQLLDDLPDGYLAIGPHALSDNGVASSKTVKGDLRYKALHHERLVAIDPGDGNKDGNANSDVFNRRNIAELPRLKTLAFVSTSDAYSFADFGKRFAWIRMAEPTIEALRQAFLDHESRILCDWSPKLAAFKDRNPNNTRHAWISSLTLGGTLGNSAEPLSLDLHPGLNVIVGGRGSGKSSVVAALRQLYSDTKGLPHRLKEEADDFAQTVFKDATLEATHRLQESQAEQASRWTLGTGSQTVAEGQTVPTSFTATVISQKELFERAAGDKNDPELTSRSLLSLVDSGLGQPYSWHQAWGVPAVPATTVSQTFEELLEDARVHWTNQRRSLHRLTADLAQLPALLAQVTVLEEQVAAFSAPEVKARLANIELRENEESVLGQQQGAIEDVLTQVEALAESVSAKSISAMSGTTLSPEFEPVASHVNTVSATLAAGLANVLKSVREQLQAFDNETEKSPWKVLVNAAELDLEMYKHELETKGLSPSEFSRLQDELTRTRETVAALEASGARLIEESTRSAQAWAALLSLYGLRRNARKALLNTVASRSGRLQFSHAQAQDVGPWISFVRRTAGIRENGYVSEVQELAQWLWKGPEAGLPERLEAWQTFLTTKEVKPFAELTGFKPVFLTRLTTVDESARYRIAAELPEDVTSMAFLREGGRPERPEDWQPIVQGSPGQRTAAMLAFVLHHGKEPLVLDQPEDDLDSEWIFKLVVKELRQSRWHRQLIVVSHNANIPVLGDAEQVIALENRAGTLAIRCTSEQLVDGSTVSIPHVGPVESPHVRRDIQAIMEGGVAAFVLREQKYNNETRAHKAAE